jgi:tetratricopeptide (TPR) repeat protein
MMFLPTKLACLYPHPKDTLPLWQVAGSAVLLVLLSWLFVRISRWRPYLLLGWLWYLITLIPVIGLVQVGKQALADRYTYVPLIGLFVIISWGVPDLIGAWLGKVDASSKVSAIIAASLGASALISLLPITYRQIGYWRDDITLWNRAIAVTRNNAVAHYNLGTTLAALGDMDGAQHHFSAAVRADPKKYDAHNNLGGILLYKGQIDKAIAHFRMAIKLKPDYPDAQCNLGVALLQRGDYHRAIVHFKECLKYRPNDAEALNGLQEAQELIDNSNRVDSKKTD